MKNVIYFLFFAFAIPSFAQTHIPDKNFAKEIRQQCPSCIDGNDNLLPIVDFTIFLYVQNCGIKSLEGIEGFRNLETLHCELNQLTSLPTLPQNLQSLSCSSNNLESLYTLPQSLQILYCTNNKLTNLLMLPKNLQTLYCTNNQLTSLPTLPQNLQNLYCSNNQLTSLPTLPQKLQKIYCSNNQLQSLPALPQSLQILYFNNNQLQSLPILPLQLQWLYCSNNQLQSLPTLPLSLERILLSNNPKLFCIDGLLSTKLINLDVSNTNIKCLPNKPVGIANNPLPICDATNSNLCFAFPEIKGTVFLDFNDDGIKNNDDVFVTNQLMEVNPYGFATTDNNGNFSMASDTSKSLIINVKNVSSKFVVKPIERKLNTSAAFAQSYDKQDFRLVPKEMFSDIEVNIVSSVQRPGFEGTLTLTYRNIGTTVLNGQIKLEKDPILLYVSAIPKENEIIGNTIIWNYSNLKPFESRSITVKVKVPTTTPINSKLTNKMFATFNLAGTYYETEKVAELTTVVGSYDPNDKTADVKNLDPKDITARKPITYTIRFQNTGTYHAERVEVQDTISPLFDLSTLKTIAVSHPNCTVSIEKDRFKTGQPTLVKWTFENIVLPDSNANEAASHGFVRFSLQPKQGLPIGTSLENKAFIYFDYNLPIITNTSKVKVEKTSKIKENDLEIPLKVYPNPSSDKVFVETDLEINGMLILSNILGQIIDYQLFTSNEISIIEIQHLPKGVYVLTLKTDKGNVSKKIVKE